VPTDANPTALARRDREFEGNAEIVLREHLGIGRVDSRGHDGPERDHLPRLSDFLLGD
jgi:hypothetical protein